MQIAVAQICIIEIIFEVLLFFLKIEILKSFCVTFFYFQTKTKPWKQINHGIEIPRPKNCDIDFGGLKHHDIEKFLKILCPWLCLKFSFAFYIFLKISIG